MVPNAAHADDEHETQSQACALNADERDLDRLAFLVDEGQLLYERDDLKLDGYSYCSQAVALAERGEFRLSIRAASKALHLSRLYEDAELQALAFRDLAIAYSYAGSLPCAEAYATKALNLQAGKSHLVLAPVQKVLGDVYARRRRYPAAIEAYELARGAASTKFAKLVDLSLANVLAASGDLDRARAQLPKEAELSDPSIRQLYRRTAAEIDLKQGNVPRAREQFESIKRESTTGDAMYHRLWAQDGIVRSYMKANDSTSALRASREAMDLAEKIRARFRSEEFKVGLFGDVQSIYERAISLSVDAGDIEGAWQLSERARARALLDAVRGRVAAAIPRSGAPATPALGTRDLRSSLREGEVVLQYHVLPERLLIWTLRQSEPKPRFVSVAVDRERLSLAIGTLHELMRQAETPSVTEIQAIGRELYGWLIAPADLREQERLIVIPHGNLHFLPFQALYDGQAYLIEKHPVASAASAALAAQSLLAAPRSSSGLVAFGNPLTSKEFHLEPLPGSEGEVARIGALFDSKAVYIGENATKQRFLSVSGSSGLLHLATHARLDLTDPLHSQIFLSPGPGHDDGALEAREIYALKLDGVALVTLSACDSGQGKVLRGDEMLGFTRSFLSAGASGLIASLWPVSDESTRQLMGLFYESLRQGNDVHRAMQSAQIGVLRTAEFSHPKRWAAFGLVGNWRMRTGG